MKSEFIYSVDKIFGDVLKAARLDKYYIGPYQRGYKWDSRSPYDQVPQLLIDVYQAWRKSEENDAEKEYFLQYITVLTNKDENAYEVIDGQQRLTTLAIIFDRLHAMEPSIPSIAEGKLDYARDDDSTTLFDKIKMTDDEFSQDLSYIIGARECIDKFLMLLEPPSLMGYANFLRDSVKIILNRENDFVKPEEVFVNLNGNSVGLTNAYLIKGLFLTRSVRRTDDKGNSYSYFNIQEQRKINGRIWDEIQNWIQQPDVAYYFFGKDDADRGMEKLLELILPPKDKNKESNSVIEKFKGVFKEKESKNLNEGYRLFNRFTEVVQSDADGVQWMENLTHAYKKLRSFYEQNLTYNLLGYVLFQKPKQRLEKLKAILNMSLRSATSFLSTEVLDLLPNLGAGELKYPARGLTPLLLSFSVFPEGFDFENLPRFSFTEYDSNQWSLEHVSPQNPKGVLTIKKHCRPAVLDLFHKEQDRRKLERLTSLIEKEEGKLTKQQVEDAKKIDEQQEDAIKKGDELNADDFPFLFGDIDDIDSMGNMALLSGDVNSSVSNNPFVIKRAEILKKKDEGYFIPPHTLAVFNKALNVQAVGKAFSSEQNVWDETDVEAHKDWMVSRNAAIIDSLKKLKDK